MSILVLIISAAVCYAAFAVTFAKAGSGIGPYLNSALNMGVATVLCLLADMATRGDRARLIPTTASGVAWSAVSGVFIALFSVLLIKLFSRGGLAYVMPAVYGGTILLTVLAGRVLFKETVNGLQLAGVAVIVLGIGMIVYAKMFIPAR